MIELETVPRETLHAAMGRGITLVTPTRRLATALRDQYERTAAAAGQEVWRTPVLMPWQQWLTRAWEAQLLTAAPARRQRLLSAEQEAHLWAEVIGDELSGDSRQLAATARDAAAAGQLLHEWGVPLDPALFRYNEDSAAFISWARRFEARCAADGWVSNARLGDLLK